MIVRCIDVETTGIPEKDGEAHAMVEAGWCDFDNGAIGAPASTLVNPGRPIPPTASAVHQLRDRDVVDGVNPTTACMMIASAEVDYYCAHNVDFEKAFFGGGGVDWLCTYKSALRIWPDAPGHKVQELRYWLGIDDDPTFYPELAARPHRAADDAYVCAHVLRRLLDAGAKVEDMSRWSRGPALLVVCFMKKHKGKTWAQVAREDPDYMRWIVDKSDVTDRDIRATCRYYLSHPPT